MGYGPSNQFLNHLTLDQYVLSKAAKIISYPQNTQSTDIAECQALEIMVVTVHNPKSWGLISLVLQRNPKHHHSCELTQMNLCYETIPTFKSTVQIPVLLWTFPSPLSTRQDSVNNDYRTFLDLGKQKTWHFQIFILIWHNGQYW